MRTKTSLYFIFFAFLPGLLYQQIQDVWRPAYAGLSEPTAYLLGIAPNLLGAISLASGLFIISQSFYPALTNAQRALYANLISLIGLCLWEVGQIWFPNGTFDVNDLIWTLVGIAIAWLINRLWFGESAPVAARAK